MQSLTWLYYSCRISQISSNFYWNILIISVYVRRHLECGTFEINYLEGSGQWDRARNPKLTQSYVYGGLVLVCLYQ